MLLKRNPLQFHQALFTKLALQLSVLIVISPLIKLGRTMQAYERIYLAGHIMWRQEGNNHVFSMYLLIYIVLPLRVQGKGARSGSEAHLASHWIHCLVQSRGNALSLCYLQESFLILLARSLGAVSSSVSHCIETKLCILSPQECMCRRKQKFTLEKSTYAQVKCPNAK